MQRELLFLNPVLHNGLNVTIRNGDKWLQAQPGDKLRIVNTKNNRVVGHATAVHAVSLPYTAVPDYWLTFEHDPTCENWKGLKAAMNEAYGEGEWGPNVTVLFFMV